MRFELGQIVATPGALEAVGHEGCLALLRRHASGDWGDLCAFDQRENERALENGTRLLSAYDTPRGSFYVITEADRSSTCILLKSEY
jgi:hypothetical protein